MIHVRRARPSGPSLPWLALACLWLAFTAWARPLALPDEGRYVGVAWEMVRSGDWLVPTLDGLPYFQKPPLFYWITAASLRLFGNHELAARLAPLVGAMLACGSLHAFARRWWSDRGADTTLLVLVTTPMLFAAAQFANMDMLVAGCITACILALSHACLLDRTPQAWRMRFAGFGFAALGVLAKGLIGVALPMMVLVLWTIATRRPRRLLALAWVPGWLLFLLVAAPWFLLMQARFPQFAHYFFVVQHVGRFTQPSFNNPQPFWFYGAVLAVLCLPWSAWMLGRRPGARHDEAPAEVRLLMWVWLVSILLFFSIPRSKLLGYILPVVPPLAFLIAQRWDWRPAAGRARGLLARGSAVLAVASCLVVIAAAAHLAHKSNRALAATLAGHGSDPVVFLQSYYFDLPFYAGLAAPLTVIDDWDAYARAPADNWHREIREAADFAPGKGERLLRPPAALNSANCRGATSWIVGDSRLASRYPILAGLVPAAEHNGVSVWKLRDWVPDASGEQCSAP